MGGHPTTPLHETSGAAPLFEQTVLSRSLSVYPGKLRVITRPQQYHDHQRQQHRDDDRADASEPVAEENEHRLTRAGAVDAAQCEIDSAAVESELL
jgi:hypothetical protein